MHPTGLPPVVAATTGMILWLSRPQPCHHRMRLLVPTGLAPRPVRRAIDTHLTAHMHSRITLRRTPRHPPLVTTTTIHIHPTRNIRRRTLTHTNSSTNSHHLIMLLRNIQHPRSAIRPMQLTVSTVPIHPPPPPPLQLITASRPPIASPSV